MELNEKNKKILYIVVAILSVLLVILGTFKLSNSNSNKKDKKEKEEQKEQITPLMYEITKDGSDNKVYLFGSMHLVNLKSFDFPKYVMDAYADSEILAPEFDIIAAQEDVETIMNYTDSLSYKDGTTIKDHLSEETYNKLMEFLIKHDQYNPIYEKYKLAFVYSLLENIMAKEIGLDDSGVDEYFLKKAKKDNKTIIDVESFEFQANMLISFDDKLYDLMIRDKIDNYDEQLKNLVELYSIWKKGDVEELIQIISSDFSEESLEKLSVAEKKLIDDYNYKLLDERNIGMKNKLIELFNGDKKVFFMVGAAHLIGDNGIANLLIQEGYNVKQVNK